jgi:hypothetical protein
MNLENRQKLLVEAQANLEKTNIDVEGAREVLFHYEKRGVLQLALQLHFVVAMTTCNLT